MVMPIEILITRFSASECPALSDVMEIFRKNSLVQVIDAAFLDDDDIEMLVGPDSVLIEIGRKLRDFASEYKNGWASVSSHESRSSPPCRPQMF